MFSYIFPTYIHNTVLKTWNRLIRWRATDIIVSNIGFHSFILSFFILYVDCIDWREVRARVDHFATLFMLMDSFWEATSYKLHYGFIFRLVFFCFFLWLGNHLLFTWGFVFVVVAYGLPYYQFIQYSIEWQTNHLPNPMTKTHTNTLSSAFFSFIFNFLTKNNNFSVG